MLLGWKYFYGVPQMTSSSGPPAGTQQAQQTQPPVPGQPSPSQSGGPAAPVPGSRAADAGRAELETRERRSRIPRVVIDTPSIAGSIALIGGRIDDVSLKRYRETVNPSSPIIKFMSPSGSPHPLYAEFGWAATPGGPTNLPNATTLWTADFQIVSHPRSR